MNNNKQSKKILIKNTDSTLGHTITVALSSQGLVFTIGLMYSILDLTASFLCNTCQIVCPLQGLCRKTSKLVTNILFLFCAFCSVTFVLLFILLLPVLLHV